MPLALRTLPVEVHEAQPTEFPPASGVDVSAFESLQGQIVLTASALAAVILAICVICRLEQQRPSALRTAASRFESDNRTAHTSQIGGPPDLRDGCPYQLAAGRVCIVPDRFAAVHCLIQYCCDQCVHRDCHAGVSAQCGAGLLYCKGINQCYTAGVYNCLNGKQPVSSDKSATDQHCD